MNPAILHPEVQQFISENTDSEITNLILKGSPFPEITIQELANQILAKQKAEKKLPTWFAHNTIYYPAKISIEQTSSEIAARYKLELVSGKSIIDLTGGFGVDTFYFSKVFSKVVHCEINSDLSEIVAHNYQQLGINNVEFFSGNGMNYLKQVHQKFDCIYIDPSRRDDVKGKVFLLKDCLPYVPPKIDFLFEKATQILIKTSPILDISNTINDLKNVEKVRVFALNNEVRELLFVLKKDYVGKILIEAVNVQKEAIQKIEFVHQSDTTSSYAPPLSFVYEPNAAILKSGGFHEVGQQFQLQKLHQHSHLYTSDSLVYFPGRAFSVTHCIPYDKKKIRKLLPNQKANVTIRNFPKSVAQIRKETRIKEGGTDFLFFTTDCNNKHIVLFCKKV